MSERALCVGGCVQCAKVLEGYANGSSTSFESSVPDGIQRFVFFFDKFIPSLLVIEKVVTLKNEVSPTYSMRKSQKYKNYVRKNKQM